MHNTSYENIFFIWLSFWYVGNSGHANVIIFDNIKKRIIRFNPWGYEKNEIFLDE